MVAVSEGAQAASYQGHSAEAGAGLAGCVRAGGILLAVLAVTRSLQPVVRTCKGHLHGCWQKATRAALTQIRICCFASLKCLRVFFLCVKLCEVISPGQFCLNLIWNSQLVTIVNYSE